MAILINDLNDPRLAPYRQLKDRELAREGQLFIAEGHHVVTRLLQSPYQTHSVLLAERRVEMIEPSVPQGVPVYVLPEALIHEVVGYRFHSGVIAAGRRREPATVEEILSRKPRDSRLTVVICPEPNNTENLGLLIRLAAGFGVDALIVGENACDPFYRQCIRVSMGTVFSLAIARSTDIRADLAAMRQTWGIELVATVLPSDAEDIVESRRSDRFGLLFGNEAQGLPDEIIALCDRRVTIPMAHGIDSLNVATSAAIFLYHYMRDATD